MNYFRYFRIVRNNCTQGMQKRLEFVQFICPLKLLQSILEAQVLCPVTEQHVSLFVLRFLAYCKVQISWLNEWKQFRLSDQKARTIRNNTCSTDTKVKKPNKQVNTRTGISQALVHFPFLQFTNCFVHDKNRVISNNQGKVSPSRSFH